MSQIDQRNEQDQQELIQFYREHKQSEPVICAHFGCGKKLSSKEDLYGKYCHQHSVQPKQTIDQVIYGRQ